MATATQQALYHKAFTTIMPLFQELRMAGGGLQPMTLTLDSQQSLARNTNPAVVVPSVSDFLCDVELTGRRSLKDTDVPYFLNTYVSCKVLVNETDCGEFDSDLLAHLETYSSSMQSFIEDVDNIVRETVGRAFVETKIYPLAEYLVMAEERMTRR